MKPFYKTVAAEASASMVERKSRFLATVRPVSTEEAALELIAQMRAQYYDATHNVYAYIIGENNIMRYSDDGEPSGTAGVPVLEVLRKEGLIDVAVVVHALFRRYPARRGRACTRLRSERKVRRRRGGHHYADAVRHCEGKL